MIQYSVYFYDEKIMKYYIYHNSGEYEETHIRPIDKHFFEHSKLTKYSILEKLNQGIILKDILKSYSEIIQTWRDELLNCKSLILSYDFFVEFEKDNGQKYINTNESNILRFFNKYSSKIYTNNSFDKISWKEYLWYEKTYNGALMKSIQGVYNCIGFDFKMSYPTILSSELIINGVKKTFYTPTKKGSTYKLEKLPYNLLYGLYRVKISSDDKDFNFIFNFKTDTNVYTHYDIEFCRKHQEKYNIKIDLIVDGEPNALLYKCFKIVDGKEIFGAWYSKLIDLKKELPKNGLIKLLSSSIWGYLSKINKRYYNDVELDAKPDIKFDIYDSEDINYLMLREKDNIDGTIDYMLVDKSQPYQRNYRLKPFITAYQRLVIAEIAIQIGINKIVRINTDNITFDKDLLTDEDLKKLNKISPTFIPEDKTTGKFEILSLNNFKPV